MAQHHQRLIDLSFGVVNSGQFPSNNGGRILGARPTVHPGAFNDLFEYLHKECPKPVEPTVSAETVAEMYQLLKDLHNQDSGCGTYSRQEVSDMVSEVLGKVPTDFDGEPIIMGIQTI